MSILAKYAPIAAAISFIASPSANAADVVGSDPVQIEAVAPGADTWVFTIAPYLWAAGLQGDVGLFGLQPVDIDVSFRKIFDHLRFGGMLVGEAHNGTWGVFADVVYINIEVEKTVERADVPAKLIGNVKTNSFTGTVMGQYRMISGPTATLDVMAGARVWSVHNDISLSLSAGGSPLLGFNGSDGDNWVDPMVGIKGRIDLNPSWYLTGWGMVGGFGAGSKVSWDLLGGVGYQWTDRVSVVAGYRALGVDFKNDGFVYDVVQSGPVLGATFRY